MRRELYRLVALLVLPALAGCASTAVAVVKAPFQLAGKAVDWTTTSQDEADRNRGRRERKAEEKQAKEERRAEKERRRAERRD